MQQKTNQRMKTIGFIMARECDHQSDKSAPSPQHDVPLAFCFTADTETNGPMMTPEMLRWFEIGYTAIAIVQFDPNMPDRLSVFTSGVLPECLQSALSKKGEGLIIDACSDLAREYN